jgi:hypothetical protein
MADTAVIVSAVLEPEKAPYEQAKYPHLDFSVNSSCARAASGHARAADPRNELAAM